jgi:hypothetical protein
MGLNHKKVVVAYEIASEHAVKKPLTETNGVDCGELQQRRSL